MDKVKTTYKYQHLNLKGLRRSVSLYNLLGFTVSVRGEKKHSRALIDPQNHNIYNLAV